MLKTLSIVHRLELVLRLIDTTSGGNVSVVGGKVRLDGEAAAFQEKEAGLLLFQNLGRRTFCLTVDLPRYELLELAVDLDQLRGPVPLMEVHLIPGPGWPGGVEFLTLEGTLPGIESLAAVRAGENACLIREFDSRRRTMKIFNPHHLELDRVHYALVDPDHGTWEPFRVVKMSGSQTLKADRVLETPFKNYYPVSPVVLGRTGADGSYCLRLRDEGEQARWLVRWIIGGEIRFRTVDFRASPGPRLEEGA